MQPILMTNGLVGQIFIKVRNTENGSARKAAIQPENDLFRIFGAKIYFKGVARTEIYSTGVARAEIYSKGVARAEQKRDFLVNLFKKCLKRLGFFHFPQPFQCIIDSVRIVFQKLKLKGGGERAGGKEPTPFLIFFKLFACSTLNLFKIGLLW